MILMCQTPSGAAMPSMPVIRPQVYFNVIDAYGEEMDYEAETVAEAIELAERDFAELCEADGLSCYEGRITVVGYLLGGDDPVEVSRETVTIDYTRYRGDYAEHNTLWGAQ